MKKLLLVLAVVGFVACNSKKEGEKTESTATQQTTTTETKPDTTKTAQPVDTTKK